MSPPIRFKGNPVTLVGKKIEAGIAAPLFIEGWGQMKRIALVILGVLIFSGCATYYPVRVNDYLYPTPAAAPIPEGAAFFVLENKNEKNPILEAEIKSKIEVLLRGKGHRISSYEQADFCISFTYSISSGKTISEIRPEYVPGETGVIQTYKPDGITRTSIVTFPGYTAYVPYRVTVFTSALTLNVLEAGALRNNNVRRIVWIGENSSTSQNPDLRDMINYLLVAAFEHFGENTGKSIIINVPRDDQRVREMAPW